MSTQIKCLLIALVLAISFINVVSIQCESEIETPMHEKILDNYKHDTKLQFKVWHYIFNKEYDYNTIQGINKYKTFKQNLKIINSHNQNSNASYRMGLNHLADMTEEEIKEYYNLKDMTIEELRRQLRSNNKWNLDDYNDEDNSIPKKFKHGEAYDHRPHMLGVRSQGSCGSCWAFATQSVLEGTWNKMNPSQKRTDWISTQQSVDCDTRNGGCRGGWYSKSFRYFQTNCMMNEKDYPYKARRGSCQYDKSKCSNTISGLTEYYQRFDKHDLWDQIAQKGPIAVAVYADNNWFRYSNGILDCSCPKRINHAVTLVGLADGGKCAGAAYIVRNSWGSRWGDSGHIKVAVNTDNAGSCNLERYGFAPTGFN